MEVVTTAQMRTIEERTAAEFGIPTLLLMENAGRQVAAWAWQLVTGQGGGEPQPLPAAMPPPDRPAAMPPPARAATGVGPCVVICCGKGNNGGDGLSAARFLHQWGARVTVLLWAQPEQLPPDATLNWRACTAAGVTMQPPGSDSHLAGVLAEADLIVDALLGTGVRGAVRGPLAQAIAAVNASGRRVLSVDVPSGLDADTGAGETVVRAECTLTLGLPKLGLLLYPGAEWAGDIRVADIGIPSAAVTAAGVSTRLAAAQTVARWLPRGNARTHKGTRGRVLIIGGSRAMPGAVALAALAALRTGAGLVYVAVPEPAGDLVAGMSAEIITWRLAAGPAGEFATAAIDPLLELAAAVDAVAVGPGLSPGPGAQAVARRLALDCPRPLVLDADGLRAFAGESGGLAAARAPRILTPHPGEMGLLLGTSATEVERDRPAALLRAAEATGATVVLKGAHSLISAGGGGFWINLTGNRVLATAGSGDVLTGATVALLAQGLPAEQAAVAGVYLHGRAGDLLAGRCGADGLLAGEILAELPAARRQLAQ